jgi:prepilin signal peptidase PulO-like enzyme (type II secretory pathway)
MFYEANFNFAEIGVMMLYTLSFIFLAAAVISLPRMIYPRIEVRFAEFPVFSIYMMVTFMNFFNTIPRWKVAVRSVVLMIAAFYLNDFAENYVTRLIA